MDGALTDNTRIQEAAYDVLRAWRDQQRTGQEAYRALCTGLLGEQWNNLATALQEWVEGTPSEELMDLPPERKQNKTIWS